MRHVTGTLVLSNFGGLAGLCSRLSPDVLDLARDPEPSRLRGVGGCYLPAGALHFPSTRCLPLHTLGRRCSGAGKVALPCTQAHSSTASHVTLSEATQLSYVLVPPPATPQWLVHSGGSWFAS